jgi:hypothetical protein
VPVISWLTLLAALIAATVAGAGVYFQRKSGRESASAARKSADAALRSAQAAQVSAAASTRSSKAAEEAVGVNRETAAGVARRAEADALAKRYQDASGQLGSENPAIRIAAVHALGRLGDDWSDHRQMCADVLCAYLLTSSEKQFVSDTEMTSEHHVRNTVMSVISKRLRADAIHSWSDLDFDFSGCWFAGLSLSEVVFNRPVSFRSCLFAGNCEFQYVAFLGGADLSHSIIEGSLEIDGCQTGSSELKFDDGTLAENSEVHVRPGFRDPALPVLSWLNLQVAGQLHIAPARCYISTVAWDLGSLHILPTGDAIIDFPSSFHSVEGGQYPRIDATGWFIEEGGRALVQPSLISRGMIKFELSKGSKWEPSFRVNPEFRRMLVTIPSDEPDHSEERIFLWSRRSNQQAPVGGKVRRRKLLRSLLRNGMSSSAASGPQ